MVTHQYQHARTTIHERRRRATQKRLAAKAKARKRTQPGWSRYYKLQKAGKR